MTKDWSLRAGVILENVMDTIQQADELEGLEDSEYVRVMFYLSEQCSKRGLTCFNNMAKD